MTPEQLAAIVANGRSNPYVSELAAALREAWLELEVLRRWADCHLAETAACKERLRTREARLRKALAKWKCHECRGRGMVLADGGLCGFGVLAERVVEMQKCDACAGDGLHIIARAALEATP